MDPNFFLECGGGVQHVVTISGVTSDTEQFSEKINGSVYMYVLYLLWLKCIKQPDDLAVTAKCHILRC